MRAVRLVIFVFVLVVFCYAAVLLVDVETIQTRNTKQTHFDTLIVLGTPAKSDGTPSPELRERIEEGVREYRAGVAPHLIMTGGAAHNRFTEGEVMAQYAEREGVPHDAILVEGQAKDTIQNIWYSRKLMEANGWHSAEVISSPYHLPRTALILEHYKGPLGLDWRTHPAHWPPEYSLSIRLQKDYREAVGSLQLRWRGFHPSRFLPGS